MNLEVQALVSMATEGEELDRSEAERPPSSPLKDPFVGNLSKCIPLPPNHLGDVRRGNLQFDSCFEGGIELLAISRDISVYTVPTL